MYSEKEQGNHERALLRHGMARLDWPLVALDMMSPQESVCVLLGSVYDVVKDKEDKATHHHF